LISDFSIWRILLKASPTCKQGKFVLAQEKIIHRRDASGAEEKQWVLELNGFALFIDFSASLRLCGEWFFPVRRTNLP
jgi:hypothetical protein